MEPGTSDPAGNPAGIRRQKKRERAGKQIKKQHARKKMVPAPGIPRPEDLPGEVQCNYPLWQKFLERYPMINSIQREDFPEHGVSFVYVAHLYCTQNTAKESSRSSEEFEDFFSEIGYDYDYSGNYDSRWFEGIGVKFG
jgi:hypothetical protein